MKTALLTVVVCIIALIAGGYGFIYSGPHAVEARESFERAKAATFPFGELVATSSEEKKDDGRYFAFHYVCEDCVAAAHVWRYGTKG